MICWMLFSQRLCTQITVTNIPVYWQEKLSAFVHGPRGAWQAVPCFYLTQCLQVWSWGSFHCCLVAKFPEELGEAWKWHWEVNIAVSYGQYNFSLLCKGPTIFLYLHHPELIAKAEAMLCSSALVQVKMVLFHPLSKVSAGWQHNL